jgi:hypothetical protein
MGKGQMMQVQPVTAAETAEVDSLAVVPAGSSPDGRGTTPSAALQLHKTRAPPPKKMGRLERAAEKYKQAQHRLFDNIGGASRREPNAPGAPTLDKVLDQVGKEEGDGYEDDDVELTSLAPPPHIDVVVQKQEHRLDALETIVRARVSFWQWKHIAGVVCFLWFTTIFIGMIVGGMVYGIGLREGSVEMGVLYSEGVEILPDEDDQVDAKLQINSAAGRASKISMGVGSMESAIVADGGALTIRRGAGRVLVAEGGVGRRRQRRRLAGGVYGEQREKEEEEEEEEATSGRGRRLAVPGGSAGGRGNSFGSASFGGRGGRVTLSPGGEAGSVHVGGAMEVHGGAHISTGGFVVGGNDTRATVFDEHGAVANSSNDLLSVDSDRRLILIGGPGGGDIHMKGGITIDATAADGSPRAITLSSVEVLGSAKLGSHPTDTLDIGSSIVARGNITVLSNPTAAGPTSITVDSSLVHLQRDFRVDRSSHFGQCAGDGLCTDRMIVNAVSEFQQLLRTTGDVYLGDDPNDVLMISGAGHFTSTLRVDANVFLGMDGVSQVKVGSNAEFRGDQVVKGSLTLGGGNGVLPDINRGKTMRVYADSTFNGAVDMKNDVTIGNNFIDDTLEIFSSTVINNFEMNMIGDVIIGDRAQTDKFTIRALTNSFGRTEIHNSVVLGTQFTCDFPDSVCEFLEVYYPGRFHDRVLTDGDVRLGNSEDDQIVVEGETRLKRSIQVDGNLTLGTGTNDCFDTSELCNSMIILQPGYCSTPAAKASCQKSCSFCVVDTSEIRMNVVSFSTFQKDVTLLPSSTLLAEGDIQVGGILRAQNDTVIGSDLNDTVTFLASSVIRAPMTLLADAEFGGANGTHSMLVNSRTTYTQSVLYEGNAVFGNDDNDTVTYVGYAEFRGDVSLGAGNSTVTSDSPAIMRGLFSAVGDVAIGDNASFDTLSVTAHTHIMDGTLFTHGDAQIGDAAQCVDHFGGLVAFGDATNKVACELTGNIWNANMNSCNDANGAFSPELNQTACELTGHTYTDDKLRVHALSNFAADITVSQGADVKIGTAVGDGSTVLVMAPSTFSDNVTLNGGATTRFEVNSSSVFRSTMDVGGAVGLYGPTLHVDGDSTFVSHTNFSSNVSIGSNSSHSFTVGATSGFRGNVSFGTHVSFVDQLGAGTMIVDVARDVDFNAHGNLILGTSQEDQLLIRGTTRANAPIEITSDFSVENVSAAALGITTLPWVSVSGTSGRVDMRGDVHVLGKFYSGSEFDLLSVRCDKIDGRDATDGPLDTGVLVEGVRMLQGGFPEQLKVSNIGEYVDGSGVLIDDVWMKDGVIVMESSRPGATPVGQLDMLTLINSGYHATNMIDTVAAIRFQQFYYHTNQISHGPDDSAKFTVGTERSWTEDPLTRDAYVGIHVTENGDSKERMHMASNGDITVLNGAGVPVILLSASLDGSIGAQNDITAGGDLTVSGDDTRLFTKRTSVDAFEEITLKHRGDSVIRISNGLIATTEQNVLVNASRVVQYVDTDFTLQYDGAQNASLAPTQFMDSTTAKLKAPYVNLEGMTSTKLTGHTEGVIAESAMHCRKGLDSVGGPVHLTGLPTTVIDATDTLQLKPVLEACAATAAQACAAVTLGLASTSGACAAAAGGACSYTPQSGPVAESCIATAQATCTGVTLDGTAARCTGAGTPGACVYTPAIGAVMVIDGSGTTVTDDQVTVTGAGQLSMLAGTFQLRQSASATAVMTVGISGTQLSDSTIGLTGQGGITVQGGGTGTTFQDDVVINSDVYVKTSTCGDSTACTGTVNINSATTVINGQTSVKMSHGGVDVLSIAASGVLLSDDVITSVGSNSVNLVAGTTFTLRHGTVASPIVMQVDSSGTKIEDSTITLQASDQVIVRATNGLIVKNQALFEAGIVQTGGLMNIAATPTISMSATTDVTISGSNSVVLRHVAAPVMTISAAGFDVTDDVVQLAGTTSMLFTAEGTFTLKREQAQPPIMVVNNGGTTLRDSQIGLVGSDMVYFQGGSQGSHFYDNVFAYTGFKVGSSDCRADTNRCGDTDLWAAKMDFNSKGTTVVNADTSFKVQHVSVDVLSISASGTAVTDSVVALYGTTSASLKSDAVVALQHGTDTVMSISSTGTVLTDSHIAITGTVSGGATPGIEITGGGTGSLFHDMVTINAPLTVSNTGAVSVSSDTTLLKGATSTNIQRSRAESCVATDKVSCSHFSGVGNSAACTSSGYACTFTAANVCEATHLANCAGITTGGQAACIQSGSGFPCTYTAAGDADIIRVDSAGTSHADHTVVTTATTKVEIVTPEFVIKQAGAAAKAMVVDATGTLVSDSTITLAGTTVGGAVPGIKITGGGTGTAFVDMATMQNGLTLTAGAVAVNSDATASLHSDQDMTLDSTSALKLQHGAVDALTIDSTGTRVTDNIVALTGTGSVAVVTENTGNFKITHGTTAGIQPTLLINPQGFEVKDSKIKLTGTEAPGGSTPGVEIMGGGSGTAFKDLMSVKKGLRLTGGYAQVNSDSSVYMKADGSGSGETCAATDLQTCPTLNSQGACESATDIYKCTWGGAACTATDTAGCAAITSSLNGIPSVCTDTTVNGNLACSYSGGGMVTVDATGSMRLRHAGSNVVAIGSTGTTVTDSAISLTGSNTVGVTAEAEFSIVHGTDTSVCAGVTLTGRQAVCNNGGSAAGKCSYVAANPATGTGDSCTAVDLVGCANIVVGADTTVCTDPLQNGNRACSYTVADGCFATDKIACPALSASGVCTGAGTCTYTPQKTGASAVAESCAVTNAMRIDSSGTFLEDSTITLTAASGILLTGGTAGVRFYDAVRMDAGLTVTAGAMDVSSSTTAIAATDSLTLKHGSDAVLAITASGTTLTDSAVGLTGSATVLVEAGTSFKVAHGVSTPPSPAPTVLQIDSAGTAITDDVLTVTAGTRIDLTGGTGGTVFRDAVNVKGVTTLENSLAMTATTGSATVTVATAAVNVGTSVAVQHAGVDVVTIAASGTAVVDDAVSITGTTSVSMTAGSTFKLTHSNDLAVCAAVDLAHSVTQTACNNGGSAAGKCSYTPAQPSTGTGDSCAAVDAAGCANIVVSSDSTVCTDTLQNGNRACTYTVADGCFATDLAACAAISTGKRCTSAGTCSYTPQKTSAPTASESCVVTDAMRIDSDGMVFEDAKITLKADQIDLTTGTFNVPVDLFTVDGPNGVKFKVNGNNGNTEVNGDLTVGGATVPALRTLTVASSDDSVVAVLSAKDSTKDATIRLTDAAGANAFDIMKDDAVFKIQASSNTGVIELNPGATSGEVRINSDKLTVHGATGNVAVMGDISVGGSSITGVKTVAVESNDNNARLQLTSGPSSTASMQLSDGTNSFTLSSTAHQLKLEAAVGTGIVQIKPGTTNGKLVIGPTSGLRVEVDTATANVDMKGNLNVEGTTSLNKLDVETALATGSSSGIARIDKATGILTSAASDLTPYTTNSNSDLSTSGASPNVNIVILDNIRVTASSVVIGTVISQCNAHTVVTIMDTACSNGRVTFKTVNLGTRPCASESYKIAFVVLN